MPTRVPALVQPPLAFAHRGARAHAPENTLEAFTLALRLGATGLESDVWITADAEPVLDHDGVAGGRLRRRPIRTVDRADLPPHVPTLAEPRPVGAPFTDDDLIDFHDLLHGSDWFGALLGAHRPDS